MNPRIKLISDTEVDIVHGTDGTACVQLRVINSAVTIQSVCALKIFSAFVGEKLTALIDVLNCFQYTGSFAALSDESSVPYVGKRVRIPTWGNCAWIVENIPVKSPGKVFVRSYQGAKHNYNCTVDQLFPLVAPTPPVKKYRPLTPVEALQHFGRKILSKNHPKESHYLYSVYPEGVYWDSRRMSSFEMLLEHYVWADTNLPCGVEEA